MKLTVICLALLVLTANVVPAQQLKKLSLDDASGISPKIENDVRIKSEGTSSVKITTTWPTTVTLGEVAGPAIENAKLVYKAKVKTELDGIAFLEMWAHVGGKRYFSRGMLASVKGKTDWKTIETPFMFQKGQKPEKVTLNIVINGRGTVWIDDVTLSKEPL